MSYGFVIKRILIKNYKKKAKKQFLEFLSINLKQVLNIYFVIIYYFSGITVSNVSTKCIKVDY